MAGAVRCGSAGTWKSLAHAGKCKNFRNFLEVAKDIPQIAGDERPLPPVLCACTLLCNERSEAQGLAPSEAMRAALPSANVAAGRGVSVQDAQCEERAAFTLLGRSGFALVACAA